MDDVVRNVVQGYNEQATTDRYLFKEILEDSEYAMIQNPYITDSYGVEIKNPINDEITTVKNLRSFDFDSASSAKMTLPSVTFKSICFAVYPDSTDEGIFETSTGESLSIASGTFGISGFSDATLFEIDKGDYTFIGISNADGITAETVFGYVSSAYHDFKMFHPMQFAIVMDLTDFTWIANNQNATIEQIKAHFTGLEATSLGDASTNFHVFDMNGIDVCEYPITGFPFDFTTSEFDLTTLTIDLTTGV